MVEGVNVQDFFNNEKENYSQEKELEKARKQLARGQTPTSSHVQTTQKRFDMSSKTPGRVQSNLGKEVRNFVRKRKTKNCQFFLFRTKQKQRRLSGR